MGVSTKSNKSHGKRSDKETQSPVLKLFRDMMQRDKHDPEKTNLLKSNKAEKRNKKHHTGSRSKSDHKTVESSCSDHRPFIGNQEMRNAEFESTRTRSIPFQGEKKESWWFWGDQDAAKPTSDETCSCVSCALKKIISTDYACIGCLVLLFAVSATVAILLVYKSIPCLNHTSGSVKAETDRPKRRIEGLSGFRWDHHGRNTIGGRKRDTEIFNYGVPPSIDFKSNLQDLSNLVVSDSELFKVLDSSMLDEIQSNDNLREFYKQLLKTDAQIQKLKKSNDMDLMSVDSVEDKYKSFPDRAKRSLKIFHKPLKLLHWKKNKKERVKEKGKIANEKEIDNVNVQTKEDTKVADATKDPKLKIKATRNKRFDNSSEPEGFMIENKKVLIQYKPRYTNRKSKCSHAPKESKSHENQLKHPFYQNTQRLDELLDKFLDKNFPEIVGNEFGLDLLFEKVKEKCKHPKIDVDMPVDQEKAIPKLIFAKEAVTSNKNKLDHHENGLKKVDDDFTKTSETGDVKREDVSTNVYGLPIVLSTMYDGANNYMRTTYLPNLLVERFPNGRKLLQTEADGDINEVPAGNDALNDAKANKKKRNDAPTLEDVNVKLKMKPANILNPNWKGPMPLYPDELNSMIKQEPVIVDGVANPVHSEYNLETKDKGESPDHTKDVSETDDNFVLKIETPIHKDSPSEADEFETDLSDMEYIEDYFRNKYDRLVQMAQAYSDYGVLESKKATADKKLDAKVKLDGPDHRVKLSISGFKKRFKDNIFKRPKKGSQQQKDQKCPSEGFRFELHPTTPTRDDDPKLIYKALQKHIKLSNCDPKLDSIQFSPTLDTPFMYSPRIETVKTTKKFTVTNDNNVIFSIGKARRSLKSLETTNEETLSDDKEDAIDTKLSIRNVFDKKKREVDKDYILNEVNNVTSAMATTDESAKNVAGKFEAINENNTVNLDKRNVLSNSTDMKVSDFFMLLAKWFHTLEGDVNSNHSTVVNTSPPNKTATIELTNKTIPIELANVTVDISYPLYDADMIENIGHRSRVLLAVDHNDDNVTAEVEHKTEETKKLTAITDSVNINITNLTPKSTNIENKIKSIVKRNADDSNLIFWNDLYDDEYGVSVDHFENNVRDKHSVGSDFMKRPNAWFRDKVKKFADKVHKKANSLRKEHKNADNGKIEKESAKESNIKSKSKDAGKRISRNANDNPTHARNTDFAALTANMKKICRKAANDVVQANKIEAREVSKEGHVASTLMQQLVRLMGNLVDYQVKQRTCRKLPPDLQNFLEWLTSSNSDPYSPGYSNEYPVDYGKTNDKTEDHTLDTSSSSEREYEPIERSDCLGTLQAVEALIRQYDGMANDEKSKITGVREYLESQKQYLRNKMPSDHGFSLYNQDLYRYRRDITEPPLHEKTGKNTNHRHRFKQAIRYFMKNLAKKHRNSKVTDKNTKRLNNSETNKSNKDRVEEHSEGDPGTVKEKRNLRDVYYKAIADAKKLTTSKHHRK